MLQAISLFPWYQFRAHLSLSLSKLKNSTGIDSWAWDFLQYCALRGGKVVKFREDLSSRHSTLCVT